MTKLRRWRGGLKAGNRSEADMTQGYFNEEFKLIRKDQQTPGNIEWQIKVEEDRHALSSLRKESGNFIRKKDVEDSIHTDTYYTDMIGGGLVYLDSAKPFTSMPTSPGVLISIGTR